MRCSIGLLIASGLLAGPALSQNKAEPAEPLAASYITKEEIEAVQKTTSGGERTVRMLDIGRENFAVGVVHRGKTVNGRLVVRPRTAYPPPRPCGATVEKAPEGSTAGGIIHDVQTEAYYITSGEGTMFTGGHIVNGRHYDLAELNGPTCLGTAHGVTFRKVKQGDIIIIPAGVVHGWNDVPDHVDYVTFRPSPGVMPADRVSAAPAK